MVTIIYRGTLICVLLEISTEVYKPYVIKDNKVKNIFILLYPNVTYRKMVASMMYYWKLWKELLSDEFKMNPYDPCVANHMVNGKQQQFSGMRATEN